LIDEPFNIAILSSRHPERELDSFLKIVVGIKHNSVKQIFLEHTLRLCSLAFLEIVVWV